MIKINFILFLVMLAIGAYEGMFAAILFFFVIWLFFSTRSAT